MVYAHSAQTVAQKIGSTSFFSVACAQLQKQWGCTPSRITSHSRSHSALPAGIQLEKHLRGTLVIHRHVFHNDKLLPVEDCRLSPGQAGIICGWGLFTTIRIFKGEAFGYERHWRRLEKDAAIIRLPLPHSGPKVRVHLQEVIRANKVVDGCARI